MYWLEINRMPKMRAVLEKATSEPCRRRAHRTPDVAPMDLLHCKRRLTRAQPERGCRANRLGEVLPPRGMEPRRAQGGAQLDGLRGLGRQANSRKLGLAEAAQGRPKWPLGATGLLALQGEEDADPGATIDITLAAG